MHPHFSKMLEYATTNFSKFGGIGFYTNGMLLNRKIIDTIIELSIDKVIISLDGIGFLNNRLRHGSKYKVIEKNMNYLLERRGTKTKPQLCTNTTISTQTDEELTEIQQAWQNRLDEIAFSGMVDDSFKILDIERARKWNSNYVSETICNQPFSNLGILWNGDVTFCCQDVAGKGIIGNVTESSLMNLWKSKELNKVRRGILTGKVDRTILCNGCRMFDFPMFKVA